MEPIKIIKIKIEDNSKYPDVAILVDRNSFLQYVKEIREILKLPVLPKKYKAWEKRQSHFEFTQYYKFAKWFINVYKDAGKQENEAVGILEWVVKSVKKEKGLFTAVDALRKASICLCSRFKKEYNFIPVVESAIAKNVVEEKDYETAFLSLYAPSTSEKDKESLNPEEQELYKSPKYHTFALYFGFYTTKTEIDHILQTKLPSLKEKYKEMANSWGWNLVNQDVITNIKRDRNWYWLYQELKSYSKVTEKVNQEGFSITRDGVMKAIQQYRKCLTMET